MILRELQQGAVTRVLSRLSFLGASIHGAQHGLSQTSRPRRLPPWWAQRAAYASAGLKRSTIYRCSECGEQSPQWKGRCPSCAGWNTCAPPCAPVAATGLATDPVTCRMRGLERRAACSGWRKRRWSGRRRGRPRAAAAAPRRRRRRDPPLGGRRGAWGRCLLRQPRGPGWAGCPTSRRVRPGPLQRETRYMLLSCAFAWCAGAC